MEHSLILSDAYFSRSMVGCMKECNVSLCCVEWGKCRTIKVVLSGDSDSIQHYMDIIGAIRIGYTEWKKPSAL